MIFHLALYDSYIDVHMYIDVTHSYDKWHDVHSNDNCEVK